MNKMKKLKGVFCASVANYLNQTDIQNIYMF